MGNLASSQLNTQSDPALVLQQALQRREQQYSSIQNPQQQLAARLGGLLGGGLVNVAQDRGFFDVNDPLLNKVSQIQGIYQQVASQIDPAANPTEFYRALQSAYSDAGLGREALAAAQEGQKAKVSGMEMQLKEAQLFKNSPELLPARIEEALKAGNEPEATRLANLNSRIIQDRELDLEIKQTAIAKDKAYIAYQTKLANDAKFEYKPVDPLNPLSGHWKFDKTGNKEPEYVPVPKSVAEQVTPPKKGDKKEGLTQEQVNALVNPKANTSTTAGAGASAGNTPVVVPNTNYQTTPTIPYDSTTKTYDLNKNPTIANLLIARNSQTNPAAIESVNQAIQTQLLQLMQQYPGVQFVGGQ
jgi:hypothetical protein